jgi:hypothetical protein
MTFQVGLVGFDGLVVGSDRRVLFLSASSDSDGRPLPRSWQSLPGTKFIKSEDDSLICAAAGGPQSKSIANAIIGGWDKHRNMSQVEWENAVRGLAEAVNGNSVGDEIIVVRRSQPSHVSVITRTNRDVGIQVVETTICTGVSTSARFLSSSLWKSTTIRNLRRLALLTLGFAAQERPGEVGNGFDLMTLEASSGKVSWETFQPDDRYVAGLIADFLKTTEQFIFPEKDAIEDDR